LVLQTENASRQIVRPTWQTTLRNRVAKRAQRCDCRGVSDQLGVKFMTQASAGKRFGVVGDDQQRAMSGLEFVQDSSTPRCP